MVGRLRVRRRAGMPWPGEQGDGQTEQGKEDNAGIADKRVQGDGGLQRHGEFGEQGAAGEVAALGIG